MIFRCTVCGHVEPEESLTGTFNPRYPTGKCHECGKRRSFHGEDMTSRVAPQAHPRPVARRGDPDTSWEAANSVVRLTETRAAVLRLLRGSVTGMTDPEIWDRLPPDERTSPSGIRTRRAELVTAGLVRDSGRRRSRATGRRMIVWEAVQ